MTPLGSVRCLYSVNVRCAVLCEGRGHKVGAVCGREPLAGALCDRGSGLTPWKARGAVSRLVTGDFVWPRAEREENRI